MSRLGDAFLQHHEQLHRQLTQYAESIDKDPRSTDLGGFVEFLQTELLAHAKAEEKHLYPAVAPLIRDHANPTATMELDHSFIESHIRAIEDAVDEAHRDSSAQIDRLRREVIGLVALFRAHLEKEERVYLPLIEKYMQEADQDALLARMHEEGAGKDTEPSTGPSSRETELDVRDVPPPLWMASGSDSRLHSKASKAPKEAEWQPRESETPSLT